MRATMNDITMEILDLLFSEEEAGNVANFGMRPAHAEEISQYQ